MASAASPAPPAPPPQEQQQGDLSLDALLSALQASQAAPPPASSSRPRLTERHAIELVAQLKQLGLITTEELHHTSDGRAFVTAARLREDALSALRSAGGRVEVAELPALLGVDLQPCERAAAALVGQDASAAAFSGGEKNGSGDKNDNNKNAAAATTTATTPPPDPIEQHHGELFSRSYFDGVAREVDELLQEMGRLTVADVASQHGLAGELALRLVRERLVAEGSGDKAAPSSSSSSSAAAVIRGRLDGNALYTPAHLRRAKAKLRGALRGAVAPAPLAALARGAGVEIPGGGGGGGDAPSVAATTSSSSCAVALPALVEELLAEGAVRGSLSAAGAVWTPAAYASAQADAARAFYAQNGWVGYDAARRLVGGGGGGGGGGGDVKAALAKLFPDGRALSGAFVSAAVVAQVEAAVEEALASGGWVDARGLLPAPLTADDAAVLLSGGAAFRAAAPKGGGGGSSSKASAGKRAPGKRLPRRRTHPPQTAPTRRRRSSRARAW